MQRTLCLGVALATLMLAAPAQAAVMVLGFGPAESCYQAAQNSRSDYQAVRTCDTALDDIQLRSVDRAATYVNRGIIYNERGEYAAALADFNAAIQLRPQLAEAHINLGIALLGQNNWEGALTELTQAIELIPTEPAKAYYNRGIANEELGRYRDAYNDYRRAAELAPAWETPRLELARFQVRR